jgi:hypothetical protein
MNLYHVHFNDYIAKIDDTTIKVERSLQFMRISMYALTLLYG